MLAYFGERISPHMTDTPEGFLICHDVPIGRVGDMDYLARELRLDGDPERVVRVSRDEAEVFSRAALASFEGKPVTDGHPPETVRPENAAAYHKGHVQNVRREGDFLVADLHITDPNLISEVRNGVKREVSCGYSCVYEPGEHGYRQKRIRGNHVAVVPRGRAGHEVAIKDAAPQGAPAKPEGSVGRGEARERSEPCPPGRGGQSGLCDDDEKGRRPMNDFWKNLLTAFGMAAKDASPEELASMAATTATVLDAEPAGKARDAEPTETVTAQDQRLDALDRKVDKLTTAIDGLAALSRREQTYDKAPEETIDEAIARLTGDGEGGGAEVVEEEKEGGELDGPTAAAAARILKNARPAIAAMKDPEEKKKVADALLESIRSAAGDTGAKLLEAARSAAKQHAQDSDPARMIAAQQAAYDARNPHKMKKEAM